MYTGNTGHLLVTSSWISRFIPVYTGNTPHASVANFGSPVYPCVYREHTSENVRNIIIGGLSLCIQGTHWQYLACDPINRFIPVYTGNTNQFNINSIDEPVYPCVYREHSSLVLSASNAAGLSLCIQGTRRKCFS